MTRQDEAMSGNYTITSTECCQILMGGMSIDRPKTNTVENNTAKMHAAEVHAAEINAAIELLAGSDASLSSTDRIKRITAFSEVDNTLFEIVEIDGKTAFSEVDSTLFEIVEVDGEWLVSPGDKYDTLDLLTAVRCSELSSRRAAQ